MVRGIGYLYEDIKSITESETDTQRESCSTDSQEFESCSIDSEESTESGSEEMS